MPAAGCGVSTAIGDGGGALIFSCWTSAAGLEVVAEFSNILLTSLTFVIFSILLFSNGKNRIVEKK